MYVPYTVTYARTHACTHTHTQTHKQAHCTHAHMHTHRYEKVQDLNTVKYKQKPTTNEAHTYIHTAL